MASREGSGQEPSAAGPLRPALEEAQEKLAEALEEACSAEVESADTGELIRIEEVLSIAGDAAKKAISIRRRLREEQQTAPATADRPADAGIEVSRTEAHRLFVDDRGVRWDAFAVYPTEEVSERARLPEPYRSGWLAFDSGGEKRRLSPIPGGWRTLPEDGLKQLCDRAEVVPRRIGTSDVRTDDR